MEDLIGKTFGRWKVLEKSPIRSSDNRIQYLCECSCEAHTRRLVVGKTLKNGSSKSCGCLRRERSSIANKGNTHGKSNAQDLTGKRFGDLIALKKLDTKKNGSWEWKCQCVCGNTVISNTRDLNAGRKTRCNVCSLTATTSKGEEKIIQLLTDNNLPFEREKTFESCCFLETNQLAKFDFFVDEKYIIEYDGEQHFKISDSSVWNDKVSTLKQRDQFKNQWCKENNIPLIRIPYTHYEDLCIDDLILETTKFKVQD